MWQGPLRPSEEIVAGLRVSMGPGWPREGLQCHDYPKQMMNRVPFHLRKLTGWVEHLVTSAVRIQGDEKWKSLSRVRLFATLVDSIVPGILQARLQGDMGVQSEGFLPGGPFIF